MLHRIKFRSLSCIEVFRISHFREICYIYYKLRAIGDLGGKTDVTKNKIQIFMVYRSLKNLTFPLSLLSDQFSFYALSTALMHAP